MRLDNCTTSANYELLLENTLKNMSFHERQYITTRVLIDLLGGTEYECQKVLDKLVEKGKLKRKFIFECPNKCCDESIIVYEGEMDNKMICETCNNEFLPQYNISNLQEVVYELIEPENKSNIYGTDYSMFFNKEKKNVFKLESYNKIDMKKKGDEFMSQQNSKKIFISHNDGDKSIVSQLVKLLGNMGIERTPEYIFCSSQQGLGIETGASIPNYIKNEFEGEMIVLLVLSNNYYSSISCLCELGATWIKAKEFIPVIIPPFKFNGIQGFIDNTVKGVDLTDKVGLNEFKKKIRKEMEIDKEIEDTWESDRNDFIEKVKELIEKQLHENDR